MAVVTGLVAMRGGDADTPQPAPEAVAAQSGAQSPVPSTPQPTRQATASPAPATSAASETTTLTRVRRITGELSPKSVVASGTGLVSAQNMMYTHTVSVFRADGTLAATVPDSVTLSEFGVDGHPGVSRGAPVEAAYTSDGRYAYVSNYSMYGSGFGPEGSDSCRPADGYDDSYVYRIDTRTFAIDQVIAVGAVPKYVAVTPDDEKVLVTNWCSWDLSVIDAAGAKEERRIPIGRYPRGVTVSPDSSTAYVAVMGGDILTEVDLGTGATSPLGTTGDAPRDIALSPDGSALYVSHSNSGDVTRVEAATGKVTHRVTTGAAPRSMAMSSDGTALYVVNYESSTVTKLRASDLATLDTVPTDRHPIGITYEPTTRTVWVACYGGSILVFSDTTPGSER
jgi:YVTN family beta-propeller protein